MGLRTRARSSPNNPYVRHQKVSPSPNPDLKASNSVYIERLPFVWKTRKFRKEFKWNGSSRWKIFRKKRNTFRGITFFPFLPRRPKCCVPFAWIAIASARLHVERKWKIYWYFVNGTTQSRPCLRCQKKYQYHLTGTFSPTVSSKW